MDLTPINLLKSYILADDVFAPETYSFEGLLTSENFETLCKAYNTDIAKSWSTDLLTEFPNSRWITYRGHRLLIRGNKDGTASVVFSANPTFEHLRIIPKTSEEYKKIKENRDAKKKKTVGEKQKEVEGIEEANEETQKNTQLRRENAKKKAEAVKLVTKNFVDTVENILGYSIENLERQKEVGAKYGSSENTKINDFDKKNANLKKLIKELPEVDKKELAYGIKEKAIKDILSKSLNDLGGYAEKIGLGEKTTTGKESLDNILNNIELSAEDALKIAQASKDLKDAINEIKSKYKVANKQEMAIVLNSLQSVGITDFDTPPNDIQDAVVREAIQKVENLQRARDNSSFYDYMDSRVFDDEGVIRVKARTLYLEGAQGSIDTIANVLLGREGFDRDVLDFLGVKNASLILAQSINQSGKAEIAKKDLEKLLTKRTKDVVSDSLSEIDNSLLRLNNLDGLAKDGTYAGASIAGHKLQVYNKMTKDIAMAGGSLEASATILDGLRDENDLLQNVNVAGGDDFDALVSKLKKVGLFDKAIIKKSVGSGYIAEIPYENASNVLGGNKQGIQRDKFVSNLKSGKLTEGNWLPKGQNAVAYDTINEAQHKKAQKEGKADGYEAFVNKEGENGYTSKQPEGETLYRKPFNVKVGDAQQETIKFLENQKRIVADLGAGLGKTYMYLGAISQLKETGKLNNSFAVLSPPSRLRAEFFKDKEKFFPNMKVLEIDELKGRSGSSYGSSMADLKKIFGDDADVKSLREKNTQELQELAVQRAKEGFFDVVLTGHDSVKEGNTYKIIANGKPAFVGIDEAHEVIQETKDSGAQSKRLKAMKTMADSAEYFVAGTGTTIKNSVGELGTLLHIARPDIVTSPQKFGRKYENINQATNVFQSGAVNQFRSEYDDVMISRRAEVEGAKLIEKKENVNITPSQRNEFKQNEKQYRLDRNSNGKVGVIDKDTNKLVFLDSDNLKSFDKTSLDFSVGGDIPTSKEAKFLKENGFDKNHRLVELGGTGASQRRDSLHERALNGGNWKENAKMIKMVENIKNSPDQKHGVFYKNKFSKDTITQALKDNGYTDDQIVFVDGEVTAGKRDKAVTKFQSDPNAKIIVFSEAGATGLNLQAMDNLHHLTRTDTYAKQQQANARGYRKGRKGDVNAFYYDSDTPLDAKKVENINRKKKLSEAVGEFSDMRSLEIN